MGLRFALFALPAVTLFIYLVGTGGGDVIDASFGFNLLLNYAWCSVVLYVVAGLLAIVRARRSTQIAALIWGNIALIGFCAWMASLMARGYVDLMIGWIYLFPTQLGLIAIGLVGQLLFRKVRQLNVGEVPRRGSAP